MAGKKNLNQGPMLLKGLDLDAVDDILDGGDGTGSSKKSNKPITNFKEGFKRGMSTIRPESYVGDFMRQALPPGYSRLLGIYDEATAQIKHTIDRVEDTEAAALGDLAETFEGQLDKLKGKLPDAVYDRIKNKLEDKKEGYNQSVKFKQAQNERDNPDALRDLDRAIDSGIGDELAEAQIDLSKATSDVEYSKLEYDVKRDGIRAKLDKSRFNAISRNLGLIADATTRSTAFNDAITYKFQQKSLELQMRSYLALRSLVELGGRTHQLHRDAYTALVTNTGLPDFRKGSEADRTKFNAKQAMLNPFRNMVNNTAADFAQNFMGQLFNNVGSMASRTIGAGSQMGSGLGGMALDSFREDPAGRAGEMAAKGGMGLLSNLILPRAAMAARPGMRKASDKLTGGMDSRLSYVLENMSSISQDYMTDTSNESGWRGYLKSGLRSVMPSFNLNDVVKDNTYQTIEQAASFNQLSQRSLVEVIPGYLARILHETRMIRTGDDSIERETYDITRGQFTSQSAAREHLSRRVVSLGTRRGVTGAMADTMSTFDQDGELSPEARHALEERLLRDAMEGRRFDPVQYVKIEGYAPGTSPEVLSEISAFFKKRFKFDEKGGLARSADNYRTRQEYSESFGNLRTSASRPITEIERLLKAGQHEALRDLGIIHTVEGEDRINYRVLREYYMDLGDGGDFGGDAPEPPSPTDPMMTRLRRSMRDKASKLRGRGGKARDAFNAAKPGVQDKAAAFAEDLQYGAHLTGQYAKGAFTSGVDNLKDVADIFKAGSDDVLIRADEIRNGDLIDVTTQKVVGSIDDIKGEVIDVLGNVRITKAEAVAGLFTKDGRKLTPVDPTLNMPTNVLSMVHQTRLKASQQLMKPNGFMSRIKDLYIQGINSPVIKATALRAGEYLNAATGKVVETIDDLTDSVVHVSNPNEVILTKQEVAEKLVDKDGRKFKSSKLWRGATSLMSFGVGTVGKVLKVGFNVLKFGATGIMNKFRSNDAYLPGTEEPVLTVARLKRGEYYRADGKVLTSFDDLRNGVYGPDGNQILDPESVSQLVTRGGKRHTAAKKRSFIRKGVKAGLKHLGNDWLKWTKSYYKGMGRLGSKVFGNLGKKSDAEFKEAVSPTDSILTRILDTLDRRLPQEQARVGSTEWQLEQMAKSDDDSDKDDSGGIGTAGRGGLAGFLSGLFGGGGRDDEEYDDDDEGDTNVYIDGGGERDRKKKPRRKKPRGRFGKAMDRMRRSKVGRGLGRITGSKSGRMIGRGAMHLGRGALMMGGGSLFTGGAAAVAGAGSILGGVATGAAALVGGIASVLASPVVLGGLAVAAVVGGGYYLWQRNKKTKGDFRSLRLMQYGIKSTGDKLKILKLEGYLEQYTNKGANPTLNLNAAKTEEIFKILKIKPDDSVAIMALANWLENRFKPVYFSYIKALNSLGSDDILLNEIDEKLDEGKKYTLLEGLSTIPPETYLHHETPFDYGEKTKQAVHSDDIDKKLTDLKKKWKDKSTEGKEEEVKEEKETEEDDTEATKPQGLAAAAGAAVVPGTESSSEGVKKGSVPTPDKANKNGLIPKSLRKGMDLLGKLPHIALMKKTNNLIAKTPHAKLIKGLVSKVPILGGVSISKMTPLQAIRLFAYGDHELEKQNISALLGAEARLYRDVRIDQHGQASYTGNLDEFIGHVSGALGINTNDPGRSEDMINWVVRRFIPVALSYFAAIHDKQPGISLSRVEASLKPEQKLDVANAIMTATFELNGDRHPIWRADTFKEDSATSKDLTEDYAKIELENLKQKIEKLKLDSPSGVNADEGEGGNRLKRLSTALWEGAKSISKNLRERVGNVLDKAANVRDTIGGALNRVADWAGLTKPAQEIAGSAYSNNYEAGGALSQSGRAFIANAEGQGGLWTQVPMPSKNKDRNAAIGPLRVVEKMTGVDADLLATFCSIESSFDYLVKAPTSSATGWFQFINATWDEQLKKHASKYGIPPDNKSRDLRKDPRINALMGAEFLKGNYQHLQKNLGITPTDTDLYCAHFMGAGGAVNFLKKDRNAIAASFFPKAAGANRTIYYKPTGQPRTIGEVYALMDSKVEKHRRYSYSPDVGNSADEEEVSQVDEAVKTVDTSDITEEVQGEVKVNSPTGSTDSLAQVSDRAAGPMQMTDSNNSVSRDMSAGGGNTNTTSRATPENPTIVDSGQHSTARVNALKAAREQAVQADRQAAEVARSGMESTTASLTLQERQLETQTQMRDLLRQIADRIKLTSEDTADKAPQAPIAGKIAGNPSPSTQERVPRNQTPPINFAR